MTEVQESWRLVFDRAQERSIRSTEPNTFMTTFEDDLRRLRRRGGEEDILSARPKWGDPLRLAAEIEALSANRALKYYSHQRKAA